MLVILSYLLTPNHEIWSHLAENVLGTLAVNTALLLACIIPLTTISGVGLGWLTGACDFPDVNFLMGTGPSFCHSSIRIRLCLPWNF